MKNKYPIIINGLVVYSIYARVSIILFFVAIITVPLVPKIGVLLIYNFFIFVISGFIFIPFSFWPKCPYCNKAILISYKHDFIPSNPIKKEFWWKWFGEPIHILHSKCITCEQCGKTSML
jgi:hypothetical protein